MNIQGVYTIYNKLSRKIYVGSSIDIWKRLKEHKRLLKLGNHANCHLQQSWNKHGEAVFKFSPLEIVKNINELIPRERFWIDKLKNKFNILDSAANTLGYRHTPEAIIKMSQAQKARDKKTRKNIWSKEGPPRWIIEKSIAACKGKNPHFLGKKHSEAAKRKISEAASKRLGEKNYWYKKQLPDHVKQASIKVTQEKFKGEGNPFYGKKHDEKTREKMSKMQKGRKRSAESCEKQKQRLLLNPINTKSYVVKTPEGETKIIQNLTRFCKELGLFPANAFTAVKKRKYYKGYFFTPIENFEFSTITNSINLQSENTDLNIASMIIHEPPPLPAP